MKKILWKVESIWEDEMAKLGPCSDGASDPWPQTSRYFVVSEEPLLEPSLAPVYADDYGEYVGLAEQSVVPGRTPVYSIDNHNRALFAFLEIKEALGAALPVVHIDAHPDSAISSIDVPLLDHENIQGAYEKSRIGDFLDIATRGELIGLVTQVVSSDEFANFILPRGPYILNLDIDIFGPEGAHIELEEKVRAIAKAWHGASVVILATSPGFVDQGFAGEIIRVLCKAARLPER